jgi:hypothetical protein
MSQLAIGPQASQGQNRHMASNWIRKLGERLANLFSYRPVGSTSGELDSDLRRIRSELDAIRVRFPDHA